MEPTQTDGCRQPLRTPRIATALAFMIACVPAVLVYWLIRENVVNVPFLDDWEFAPLVEKFCQGQMTFADLYAPHLEHRMVFPRLVFLATFLWGHGSLAISIWFSFCTVLAASWCVFRLSRPTGWPLAARWLLVGAANLALFSPIQVL